MDKIQWMSVPAAMLLQVLIISSLLRGQYRRYPFLLLLLVSDFLGAIVGSAATFDLGRWTVQTAKYYWIMDGLQYSLVFACQVQMLYQAIDDEKNRNRLVYVVMGAFLFLGLSTWQAYDHRLSLWMTQLVRNFSFGSMFVNLTLWTLMIRRPDQQRLLITAGFGILLAGGAIGHSLRQLSRSLVWAGNLVLLLTYLTCLYTIWRAVSRTAENPVNGPGVEDVTEVQHKAA